MKRLLALGLLLAGVVPGLHAQSPDGEFLQIYSLIQEGETLERTGQLSQAMDRFKTARTDLEQFAKSHPAWNRTIVNFRLGYLGQKLGSLRDQVPAAPPVASREPTAPPTSSSTQGGVRIPDELEQARTRANEAEARAAEAQSKLAAALHAGDEATALSNELRDRSSRMALDLRRALDRVDVLEAAQQNLERTRDRLERERSTLQSKLNEALSPRPAGLDPATLSRSEERNRVLVIENEILKACLDRQMVEFKQSIENARRAAEFEQQLRAARADLEVARHEAEGLREERQKLQARLESVTRKSEEETASLRREIDSLRKDLVAARRPSPETTREMATLQSDLADERTLTDHLRRENAGLRREVERLASMDKLASADKYASIRITPASLKVSEVPSEDLAFAEAARARRLERDRDELRRQLEAAHAELRRRGAPSPNPNTESLAQRVDQLEAHLKVFASQREPYTAEELALFATSRQEGLRPMQLAQAAPPSTPSAAPVAAPQPPVTPAQPIPASTNAPARVSASTNATTATRSADPAAPGRRRTSEDLPPGAGLLARQAERAFTNRRLDEAEKAYREILEMDRNNVYTLGNLAMILVEEAKMEEGEAMVKRALALDAEDPFNLSLLGLIRFRQQRFDEAFDALSRSAELDPNNAETFNYLGITLSERGDRKAAETALRKAIKLNPNSAMAHYNLAVVYATQKPPFLDLARFHYARARRVGQPANPSFEQILRGEEAPPKAPGADAP